MQINMSNLVVAGIEETRSNEETAKATGTKTGKNAQRNRELWLNARGGKWDKWRRTQQQAYDFSLGDQLTSTELTALTKAGMPTFIVNKMTPDIETLRYFATANNPKPVIIGRDPTDVRKAAVVNALWEYSWDQSKGKSVASQVVRDALSRSVGYFIVYHDQNSDNGLGDVLIGTADTWDVYWDPTSTDILYRDAEYCIVQKNIKRKTLKLMLPDYENLIGKAVANDEHAWTYSDRGQDESGSTQPADITTSPATVTGKEPNDEDYIDYYEGYFLEKKKYWNIAMRTAPTEAEMQVIVKRVKADVAMFTKKVQLQVQDNMISLKDAFDKGEMSQERMQFEAQKIQMGAQEQVQQYEQQLMTQEVEAASRTETRIISDHDYKIMVKDEEIKNSMMEIVPFWKTQVFLECSIGSDVHLYDHTFDMDYIPVIPVPYIHTGTVYPMSAAQLVKGNQEMINKAHQLMIHNVSLSSSVRWMYSIGSIDVKKWETDITLPGALLGYNPSPDGKLPITPVYPNPLPTAFPELISMGISTIDDTLGVAPVSTGKAMSPDTPYRALVAQDEFGSRRIKAWVRDMFDPALEHLARVWLQMAKLVYSAKKVFRVVNPDTSETQEFAINVPVYDDYGKIVGRWNDIGALQYDIKFQSGSTLPVNRWAKAAEKREDLKLGIVDDIAVLQELDYPDKDAIIKRKSIYAQMQAQIGQMDEQIKQLKGTNETLTRQIIQSGIKDKIQTSETEINKAVADHKAGLTSITSQMQADVKTVVSGLQQEAEYSKKRMRDEVTKSKTPKKE